MLTGADTEPIIRTWVCQCPAITGGICWVAVHIELGTTVIIIGMAPARARRAAQVVSVAPGLHMAQVAVVLVVADVLPEAQVAASADLAVAESNLKVIDTEIREYAYITSPINGIVLDRNINVGDTVVDTSSNNSTSIFTLAENLQ